MSTLKVNNVTDLGDDAVITDGALVGAGKILQVVSTNKLNTFSTASTSYVDVTGLSATITPSSTSSKILVTASIVGGAAGGNFGGVFFRLSGGNSGAFIGDAGSGQVQAASAATDNLSDLQIARTTLSMPITHLDSPGTTSAVTYQVQMRANNSTAHLNRSDQDSASGRGARTASSITLMEVAG